MFDFLKKLFKKNKKTTSVPHKKSHPVAAEKKPCECCKRAETAKKAPEKAPEPPVCETTAPVLNENVTTVEEPATAPDVVDDEITIEIVELEEEKSEPDDAGEFLIELSEAGIYTFKIKDLNGDVVVTSGEYTLKRSCVSGIQSVKKNGFTENTEDQTAEKIIKKPNPKYEMYSEGKSKYRFRLKAPNGYIILTSPTYTSKKACLKAIESVRKCSQTEKVEDSTKYIKD